MVDREPQPSLRPDQIVRGERYRRDLGDIDALAASIKRSGLLHPVVVTSDRQLVAGERRLAAVQKLGWLRVPVRVIDPEDLLTAERDENEVRMDFLPSEAVAIAAAIRPAEQALSASNVGGRPSGETVGKVPTVYQGPKSEAIRSEARVAAAVGMSRHTLRRAEYVVKAAEVNPELAPLVERMDETGKVKPAYEAAKAAVEEDTGSVQIDHPSTRRMAAVIKPRRVFPWLRYFTKLCNRPLPEDREVLLRMDRQLHDALTLIGANQED